MTKLTIFIQCHNRPAYAKCAIESVLHQTNQNFRLVISDNSSNDDLYHLIQAEFPTVEYRRRAPSLTAFEHFNKSISEADTDFLCLFHDDDLMEPEFVESMLSTISLFPDAVAYSCNGVTIDNEIVRKGSFFESDDAHIIINDPRTFAARYFSKYPRGFAAFPAYIYRSSIVNNIPINARTGGKYSDVAWLLEISKNGTIVWNVRRLILYRMHLTNDSGAESLIGRLKLLGFLKLNMPSVGQAIINDYRFGIYKDLLNTPQLNFELSARYLKLVRRYLLVYRLKRITKPDTFTYFRYKLTTLFTKVFARQTVQQVSAQEKILKTKYLFLNLLRIFRPYLILDVGSLDGSDSLRFRRMSPKSKIIAFEANPYNYAKMQSDPRLTLQNIEVRNSLVSCQAESGKFYISKSAMAGKYCGNMGTSSLMKPVDPSDVVEEIEVNTIRLDEVIAEASAPADWVALWIDVEGAAYEVLSCVAKAKQQVALLNIEVEVMEFWVAQKLKDDVIQLANELGLVLLARSNNDRQQDLVMISAQLLKDHGRSVKLAMLLTKWLGPASSRLLEKL